MRFRRRRLSSHTRKQRQRTVGRNNRTVGITHPGETADCQLKLFFRLHQPGTQVGSQRRCHIPLQQSDIALLVTQFSRLLQTNCQLALFAVKGTKVCRILIISPGTFHLRRYLFAYHVAIIFARRHLLADQSVFIERSQKIAQRLGDFQLVVTAYLTIDLPPGIGEGSRSRVPGLSPSSPRTVYRRRGRLQTGMVFHGKGKSLVQRNGCRDCVGNCYSLRPYRR